MPEIHTKILAAANKYEINGNFWLMAEKAPWAISIVRDDYTFEYVNPNFTRMLGYTLRDLPDMKIWFMKAFPDPNYMLKMTSCWESDVHESENTGEAVSREVFVRCKDGAEKMINMHTVASGYGRHFIYYENITEKKEIEDRLKYLSFHDSLTGLYNQNYFNEEIQRLGNSRNSPVGLIICDLDGLKYVNDNFGHKAGDEMLANAAKVMKNTFRSSDVVARIGGDEFAILITKTSLIEMDNILTRLKAAIKEHNAQYPDSFLSLSVGLALSSESTVDIKALYHEADINMYAEKSQRKKDSNPSFIPPASKTIHEAQASESLLPT